jgi:hypothetical protein
MIEDYLRELRASLRTSRAERDRILAEAQDHLWESARAGMAAGLTEHEAEDAAISAFGSVRAVVRAHRRSRPRLMELALAGWGLGAVTLIGIGASGLIAAVFNRLAGPSFVGGAPAGTVYSGADCKYWQSIWHASTCGRAAMLEISADAVSLRVIAGLAGVLAIGGYLVARRVVRARGPLAGPLPPALIAAGFGAVTAGLGLLAGHVVTAPVVTPAGPGWFLSGALVTGVLTARYALAARPARG